MLWTMKSHVCEIVNNNLIMLNILKSEKVARHSGGPARQWEQGKTQEQWELEPPLPTWLALTCK